MPSLYSLVILMLITLASCSGRLQRSAAARKTLAFVSAKNHRIPSTTTTRALCNVSGGFTRSVGGLLQSTTSRISGTRCFSLQRSEEDWLELSRMPLSSVISKDLEEYTLPPPPPCVLELEEGQRVVSFGDVHGDIHALKEFLVVAGVMSSSSSIQDPKWCGGTTVCVQVGDVLDRGDDELACLRLLASLSRQAADAGGALVLLYGNHESLNAAGLFQYANDGGNQEYDKDIGGLLDNELGTDRWRLQFAGNQPSRWAAMEPGGLLAKPLLANMKVAMVVGRSVFVHAGLTAQHLRSYGGVAGMNQSAQKWFLQSHHGENNNLGMYNSAGEVIRAAQSRAQAASSSMPGCLGGGIGSESPVWMRDYSSPSDSPPKNRQAQKMIDDALQEVGNSVQRMVMGHTPQRNINAALKGKAWRVDVGASKGVMNGTPEVLEIIHGGDGRDDVVNILSKSGAVVSAERQVIEQFI